MGMHWLFSQRITMLLLLLWLVTCLSWLLGHGDGLAAPKVTAVVVFLVAACKARIVLRDFMEVRTAPLALRIGCDAWVAGVTIILIGFSVMQ